MTGQRHVEGLKVAVIGVGAMGKNHARVLSEMGALFGVADPDRQAREEVARRFSARSFSTPDEILREDIDAVVVATPTVTHHDIVLSAIKAGKHVLVEKPIAATVEEAEEMVREAEKMGVVLAVGQIERHNPAVGASKQNLVSGNFGDMVTMTSKRVSSFPSRIRDVGVILDLGIHDIDVMRYLSGRPVRSVYATGGHLENGKYEKYGGILLEFEDDVAGFVEVNWLTPMKVRKLWLTCEKAFVEIDYMAQVLRVSSSTLGEYDVHDLFHVPLEYNIREFSLKKTEPLRLELEDFLNAVRSGKKPLVDGRDGMETLRVALAAVESYRKQERITLQS